MKLFLSADMEGTAGVTLWEETETGKRLYDHFARQMSSEVAAACEGAIAGGATEIVVKDAHRFCLQHLSGYAPRAGEHPALVGQASLFHDGRAGREL